MQSCPLALPPRCTHGTRLCLACCALQTSPFPPVHGAAQKGWVGFSARGGRHLLSCASGAEGISPHPQACAPKATVFAFSFLLWVPCHMGASEQESHEVGKAPALLLNHPAGKASSHQAPDLPHRCWGPFLGWRVKGGALWSPSPLFVLGLLFPMSLSLANSCDE